MGIGIVWLGANGEGIIFRVLKVAPEMAPGVRFRLRNGAEPPFSSKMQILGGQAVFFENSMVSGPAVFQLPDPAPNPAPSPPCKPNLNR